MSVTTGSSEIFLSSRGFIDSLKKNLISIQVDKKPSRIDGAQSTLCNVKAVKEGSAKEAYFMCPEQKNREISLSNTGTTANQDWTVDIDDEGKPRDEENQEIADLKSALYMVGDEIKKAYNLPLSTPCRLTWQKDGDEFVYFRLPNQTMKGKQKEEYNLDKELKRPGHMIFKVNYGTVNYQDTEDKKGRSTETSIFINLQLGPFKYDENYKPSGKKRKTAPVKDLEVDESKLSKVSKASA